MHEFNPNRETTVALEDNKNMKLSASLTTQKDAQSKQKFDVYCIPSGSILLSNCKDPA